MVTTGKRKGGPENVIFAVTSLLNGPIWEFRVKNKKTKESYVFKNRMKKEPKKREHLMSQ